MVDLKFFKIEQNLTVNFEKKAFLKKFEIKKILLNFLKFIYTKSISKNRMMWFTLNTEI